jgi:hypothetical protein
MRTHSPFHIQELVEEISKYLEQSDLARCAQVCKAWYECHIPLLYRQVRYDKNSRDNETLWTGFQRYSHHIRAFAASAEIFPEPLLLGSQCRHLTELSLGPLDFLDQPDRSLARLKELIAQNPSIRTLQIDLRRHLSGILFRGQNFLRLMPSLKNLAILDDRYPYAKGSQSNGAFEAILECGSQLETLTYQIFWGGSDRAVSGSEPDEDAYRDAKPWTGLSSLTICGYDGWRELELVKRSPNLRRLNARFKKMNCDSVLLQMALHYQSGHPSRLEHLELSHLRGQRAQTALEMLLQSCARTTCLKTISLYESYISEITTEMLLTYHGNTLEKVAMANSNWINPYDFCRMFTMCPQLKHLEATGRGDKLWLQHLVQSPWACMDLRTLNLTIIEETLSYYGGEPAGMSSGERASTVEDPTNNEPVAEPQRLFWRKIGMLKNLGSLHINTATPHSTGTKLLSIVDADVEHLCRLTRLWELRIPSDQDFITDAVKEELHRRRPGLRVIYG